jgi:hypothetical protein
MRTCWPRSRRWVDEPRNIDDAALSTLRRVVPRQPHRIAAISFLSAPDSFASAAFSRRRPTSMYVWVNPTGRWAGPVARAGGSHGETVDVSVVSDDAAFAAVPTCSCERSSGVALRRVARSVT